MQHNLSQPHHNTSSSVVSEPQGGSAHSLALRQLLGGDFVRVFASCLQVVASHYRAGLRGHVGVPEGNLAIEGGDG